MFVDRRHECRRVFVDEHGFGSVIFMWMLETVVHVGDAFAEVVDAFLGVSCHIRESISKESEAMSIEIGQRKRMSHEAAKGTSVPSAVGGNVDCM